ncbi:MAG: ribonuclease III [Clostridia bacterium]|nr:ribonuclease III [Clostridia bacterium]
MNSVGGYEFVNPSLLCQALTHSSFSENNYERFEFLGDSILDFLVAKYFFTTTDLPEGKLTKTRAYLVSQVHLAEVFDELNLESCVKLGKSVKTLTPNIKCDIVEAVVGAVFLDSDIQTCEKFILENLKLTQSYAENNYKSALQEYAQANKIEFSYQTIETNGKSHNLEFVVECKCGKFSTIQKGMSKNQAQQKCAKIILEQISKEK